MPTSKEVRDRTLAEVRSGASFSVEGLRELMAGWEGAWQKCLPGRSPMEFDSSEQAVEAAGVEESRRAIEVSDEDRQQLVRYWTYFQQLAALEQH